MTDGKEPITAERIAQLANEFVPRRHFKLAMHNPHLKQFFRIFIYMLLNSAEAVGRTKDPSHQFSQKLTITRKDGMKVDIEIEIKMKPGKPYGAARLVAQPKP